MPVKAKGKFRVTILGVSVNETSRILFPVERDGCVIHCYPFMNEQTTKYKLTLNDMNYVLTWTHKSSIHRTFYPKLLFQGFRVAFNQSVVGTSFVDVNLCSLQGRIRT